MKLLPSSFIAMSVLLTTAMPVLAQSLTRAEQTVCASLRHCMDIVTRHDASEFDYDVLTQEFQRFGTKGREALFSALDGNAAKPEIASLIAASGPLSSIEGKWLTERWTPERMTVLLPLAKDGTVRGRNLLLSATSQKDATIRIEALRALSDIPDGVRRTPLPEGLYSDILNAASNYPDARLAPYLENIPTAQNRAGLEKLLASPEFELVKASYSALYRAMPEAAFQALLRQLKVLNVPEQSEAIGTMLADRHARRADGFYARFAADLSGDESFPELARAAGLHGYLLALANNPESILPDPPSVTSARKSAMKALLTKPSPYLWTYFSGLDNVSDPRAATLAGGLWSAVIQSPTQTNPDFLERTRQVPNRPTLLRMQLESGRLDYIRVALREISKRPDSTLSAPIATLARRSPFTSVRLQAAELLGQNVVPPSPTRFACTLPEVDLADLANQMPYFDDGEARVNQISEEQTHISRQWLSSAQPTKTGWLAGYNGGEWYFGLVHFDNQSGNGQVIKTGSLPNILAILPERKLPLGQMASRFWVVTYSMIGNGYEVWQVGARDGVWSSTRITALSEAPSTFGVSPQGILMLQFTNEAQPPLAISSDGRVSLACGNGS